MRAAAAKAMVIPELWLSFIFLSFCMTLFMALMAATAARRSFNCEMGLELRHA